MIFHIYFSQIKNQILCFFLLSCKQLVTLCWAWGFLHYLGFHFQEARCLRDCQTERTPHHWPTPSCWLPLREPNPTRSSWRMWAHYETNTSKSKPVLGKVFWFSTIFSSIKKICTTCYTSNTDFLASHFSLSALYSVGVQLYSGGIRLYAGGARLYAIIILVATTFCLQHPRAVHVLCLDQYNWTTKPWKDLELAKTTKYLDLNWLVMPS